MSVNLDAMSPDKLMKFWARHQRGRNSKELFPNGGRGSRTSTAALANYASNKATAIACRLRGDIQAAVKYEHICDMIYDKLPQNARFW